MADQPVPEAGSAPEARPEPSQTPGPEPSQGSSQTPGPGSSPAPDARPPQPGDELEDSRMPFLEHLRELRVRLRNAVIALVLGFIVAFLFSQELFVVLARPLVAVWAQVSVKNPSLGAPMLYFGSLVEPFWVYLSVALWGGIFVASPAIFHQLWMFVAPGLYRHERRYGVAFAASSGLLFIGGAVFCYFLVLPAAYRFFLNYSTHNLADLQSGLGVLSAHANAIALQPLLGMDAYLDFVKKLLLGFGLVFELPLLILFLTLAGAVTHRSLWRFNRWFIVLSFVVAAILTPGPDVISQVLMALPMVALYNGSIFMAYIIGRRRAAAAKAAEASITADD
jgi:sec-independent protein translocase protein TatC